MAKFTQEKEICSLDEIEQDGVKYWFVDENGKRTGKWVWVEKNYEAGEIYFTVNRKMYRHQLYDFELSGNCVRSWKTLNGAIRFCQRKYADLVN